ncbi:hypothetical protein Aph01nite_12920 [Acrocarpospora phusangensis]|uniref:DUF2637 domain-containing protein n=1 Tax=Acrocarpospora phusangensis TaxID=1070424 RepID=A0A919UM64_9ACTN|nr:DUF2637 domain-containing protein [Acrocarpospora phusangensis]GIH22982.1 hypothetical protein Aph01nite_12920 [Acrocarpospora phusangensis]
MTNPRPAMSPATRRFAFTVISVIAAVAAYVSFRHQFGLAIAAKEPPEVAWTLPVLIDGMIAMASLVMLDTSKRGQAAPWLARLTLAAGALATLAANVAHGWSGGWESRLISAVAPLVLVVAYELLMGMLRRGAIVAESAISGPPADQPSVPIADVPVLTPAVPRTASEAARAAYEASITEGKPISERGLGDRFNLTRPQARQTIGHVVIEAVAADLSGQLGMPQADRVASQYGVSLKRAGELIAAAVEGRAETPVPESADGGLVAGPTPGEVLRERYAAVNGTGRRDG